MQLNITDLEAERKRREFALIEHAARVGGVLPKPEFRIGHRDTDISFGPIKISVWSEIGQDIMDRKTTVTLSDGDLESKLFALFPDRDVTKKLHDHIWMMLGKYISEEQNAKLERNGDAEFCR